LGMGLHQIEAVTSNGHGGYLFSNEMYDGVITVSAAIHHGWRIEQWVTHLDKAIKMDDAPIIYPNPASDLLTIELGSIHIAWRFEIFDEKGIMIDKGRSWGTQFTMDVSAFAPGVYTIILLKGKQYYPYRFIKE
jgi:Secretion system C-terminal sorting domain